MSSGLFALLDDVAGIAKIAAASLDDVVGQTAKAGGKVAGIVIDDAAVTPRYVVGFAANRELPIIRKIATGSLKNKVFYLLPAALLLSAFAPWAITPLLMAGGAFLCFEGYEKIYSLIWPGDHASAHAPSNATATDYKALEDQKVAGAIRTDMILSAEIMAIALSSVTSPSLTTQAIVLAVVALLVTVVVYGAVALIVKADDAGVALARNESPALSLLGLRSIAASTTPGDLDRIMAPMTKAIGRALVDGMPAFLAALSLVGTLAMLWVGGAIIVHGLREYGLTFADQSIHEVARTVGGQMPLVGGLVEWLIGASFAGLIGLAIGWLVAKGLHLAAISWL